MENRLKTLKEKYLDKCNKLISKYNELNIIYLRVSTKNEGQDENDQLKDIIRTFRVDIKKCLIIKAKESGYQIKKQKFRKFTVIKELLSELDINIPKKYYFWSIDRIYRNRKLTEEFYEQARKTNTKIYSYQEQFINLIAELQDTLPADFSFIIDQQVKQLVSFFAWMAEMESKKRGDRLIKSLTKKDNRYYTNKGNLYGRKLRSSVTGKKINLTAEQLDRIEKSIAKALKKGKTYKYIKNAVREKLKISVSNGYIFNMKTKYNVN